MSGQNNPDPNLNQYSHDDLLSITKFLQSKVSIVPKVAVICGSGLGPITDTIENPVSIPYEQIPNFPVSTVQGHGGTLVFGTLSNIPIVCLKGRFHFYEGYPLWKCCMPVRIMKLLGCTHLIVTNAAGGPITDTIENPVSIPYEQIPNFPVSTVQGHGGTLVFGTLSNIPIVCLKGRFHFYEGYPLWKCCMPVRIMKLLGCTHLIVTNAAGGINQNFKLGDIMLIKDHVNFLGFAGNNPLRGPNEDVFGTRFPGMNDAYDKNIIKAALEIAKTLKIENRVHQGVYASVGGPNYETVAELRLMQTVGIDAVGMSTVPEVIIAKHSGLNVFAFSLITNECILDWDSDKVPNHAEVLEATKKMEETLQKFVKLVIEYIGISTCDCKQ